MVLFMCIFDFPCPSTVAYFITRHTLVWQGTKFAVALKQLRKPPVTRERQPTSQKAFSRDLALFPSQLYLKANKVSEK